MLKDNDFRRSMGICNSHIRTIIRTLLVRRIDDIIITKEENDQFKSEEMIAQYCIGQTTPGISHRRKRQVYTILDNARQDQTILDTTNNIIQGKIILDKTRQFYRLQSEKTQDKTILCNTGLYKTNAY